MSDPFAVPDGPLPGQDVDPDISPDPDGSGETDDTSRDPSREDGTLDGDEEHKNLSDLP